LPATSYDSKAATGPTHRRHLPRSTSRIAVEKAAE
jgi:hypothetical protein